MIRERRLCVCGVRPKIYHVQLDAHSSLITNSSLDTAQAAAPVPRVMKPVFECGILTTIEKKREGRAAPWTLHCYQATYQSATPPLTLDRKQLPMTHLSRVQRRQQKLPERTGIGRGLAKTTAARRHQSQIAPVAPCRLTRSIELTAPRWHRQSDDVLLALAVDQPL